MAYNLSQHFLNISKKTLIHSEEIERIAELPISIRDRKHDHSARRPDQGQGRP